MRAFGARPAVAIGAIWLATRLTGLVGMVTAKHGDLGAALGAAATNTYDASWYRAIAAHGYVDPHLGGPVTIFYPGYPLAVAAVYWPVKLVGSLAVGTNQFSPFAADVLLPAVMLLVSNLALLAALLVLWRLYGARLGATSTVLGIGFLLAAPTGFFLSAGYSESLFILAAALAFLFAENGRWIVAGLAGAAACLIRFPGAFLLVPLVIIWLRTDRPRRLTTAAIGAGLFAAGAVAYPAWLWANTGDPLAYLHLQNTHHRGLAGPWTALAAMTDQVRNATRALRGHPSNQRLVDVPTIAANSLALVAGVATAVLGWTRLRAYEVAWVILVFLVPLFTGTGESLDRYWLAAFPVFFLIGWWLRRWPVAAIGLMALSTVWLFVLSYNFARVIWVG